MRSLRDRFLSWFYPNRGWSADLHEAPRAPAATEPEADAVPPETTAICGARANAGEETMYGKILSFSHKRSSGAIQSDQGDRFDFDIAAVLAYDVAGLTEGQVVNFEPDGGSPPKAMNVSVLPPASIHYSEDRYREIRRLRYVGFEQHANIRTYRFERFTPGELTQHFVVNTDMVLFGRHKVRLQEGPLLCLHLLTDALGTHPAGEPCPYSLTEQHMLAFLASRAEPAGKAGPKTYLRS